MIIYHHKNDVFHCIYRILSIFEMLDSKKIEVGKLKIIDFYLTFPHLLVEVRMPNSTDGRTLKKFAKNLENPYENFPNSKILFSEMGDFQSQAIDILRSKDILTTKDEWIGIGESFNHEGIVKLTAKNSYTSIQIFKILVEVFSNCELNGKNGLKNRTSLMEFRYDAV